MDCRTCPNLVVLFLEQAKKQGDRPFLWVKEGESWRATSWAETRRQVLALARGLRKLGLAQGDRVALVAENRPEWVIADLAILAAGAITVPAYTTNTSDDHRHVLSNSGARFAIVSTAALAQRVLTAVEQVSSVEEVISIDRPEPGQLSHADHHLWHEVMASGEGSAEEVEGWARDIQRADVACLIHTSGTGGLPKGVMTTHGNILANCHGAVRLLETIGLGDEVFLSFLPLSHSYEHTGGMFFPIALGAQIYFAEKVEVLAANMVEVRPTIMTAVPRLYETMHQRILRQMEREAGMKAKLFFSALRIGRKRIENPRNLTIRERALDTLLDRLVRKKVMARFGGRLKALVSGGAPLNPEIGMFFLALGRAAPPRLRPDRSLARRQRQSSEPHQDRHGRAALGRRRDQVRRGRRDPGARRSRYEGLLERPRGDQAHDRERLAPYRRHRQVRQGRLHRHHGSQTRLHQEFGRRYDLAGAGRGRADDAARDRPGDGVRRPAALSRRA